MLTYTAYDAKAKLSALLDQVAEHGQTVLITRHGKPVAKVVPIDAPAWVPVWAPHPALGVDLHEDPATPTYPGGFPAGSSDAG